jgi:hypothetical protein
MAQVFKEDWAVAMQARLSEKTKWKDFMRVDISDKKVLHNPSRTDATVATLTRYTSYTAAQVAQTDENVSIDASFIVAEVIDRADLAQTGYLSQMESADHQGTMLNEKIESYIYSQHALVTDFGDTGGGVLGLASTAITVSATNIDNIITSISREISAAKGDALYERNGGFFVWRPADFEFLQQFMMANGFSTADAALKSGVEGGIDYMGFTHYRSSLLTAGHVLAGVKKVYHLGILKSTYGQIVVDEKDPGLISGVGVTSRLDLKVKAWTKTKPLIFDVNVA